MESNGFLVYAAASEPHAPNEFPWLIQFQARSLQCLGVQSQAASERPEHQPERHAVVVMIHNASRSDRQLLPSIHQILMAAGATSQEPARGYLQFKSSRDRPNLELALHDTLATHGYELRPPDREHYPGLTHKLIGAATSPRGPIAEIVLGNSIDLETRNPCTFLAVRPAGFWNRLTTRILDRRYSRVHSLCSRL